MVLLVGGNSGQEGEWNKNLHPLLTRVTRSCCITSTSTTTLPPTYSTTMTIQSLWQRVKKSKWYRNFRISLLLERWSTLSQEQMKTELRKQQLNRMLSKPKHDKN